MSNRSNINVTSAACPVCHGSVMAENDSPRYLILDTESVPDGLLIGRVRYPKENLGEAEAIARAQTEARERSSSHSDFLPVTFQIPVAVCLLSVGADFRPRELHCLDAPDF